ncbi:ABC transporter ATP-binding protein [Spirochaeta thermophila]|uniref:Transporter n=1 Tax=Winmispira thermophila (strain ATCC 49972 / DSM 6192 / RI 19.B1) TaxID=665571 RepID=E0RQY6_WINT6|nr:ABC transporter ATP-binding protein [Spirochaeta thermophila]ADN01564.1 transporter [Spirochaeta thermophila DSM 6192]
MRSPTGPFRHQAPLDAPRPTRILPILTRLWRYLRPYRTPLLVALLAVLATTVASLAAPLYLKTAVNAMASGPGAVNLSALLSAVLTMAALYLASTGLTWIQVRALITVTQGTLHRLRTDLFSHLQRLPIPYLDRTPHGDLMSRLTNDVATLETTLSQTLTQLASNILLLVGSLAMMLALSPLLTLLTALIIPLAVLTTRTLARMSREAFRNQQHLLGTLNAMVEETAGGLRELKAFGRERRFLEDFTTTNERFTATAYRAMVVSSILPPIMNALNGLSFPIIALAGGYLALEGHLSVGVVAAFLTYARQFSRPINEISNQFTLIQSALAGAERIFQLLDVEEERDIPEARPLTTTSGHLTIEHLTFGYDPARPVLRDITLDAPSGSLIAIVGPTGAGKTTLVNLLMRFYDPQEGRILLDGKDTRTITRASLRSHMGMVLQDTHLFTDTIRENIRYGRPDATDEEVEEAARIAEAHHFIQHLPQGYDTLLTDRGSSLSEGQRQLLTIARAVLTDPAVLILDEATSSVDTRTERHLQKALRTLMKGRTSFVIAHRLSTVREADLILVIREGRIVEQGTHEELMRRKGLYWQFHQHHQDEAELPTPGAGGGSSS